MSRSCRPRPDCSFEITAQSRGAIRIAGVDEVGRGPLAGPVVAAAVIFDHNRVPEGLDDSKRLSAKRRAALVPQIEDVAVAFAVGEASVEEIDRLNILQASLLAMSRAVAALHLAPDHLLIDGNRLPADLPCPAEAIVKGDARSVSISAAAILAKEHRDRLMVDLAQHYPGYGWDTNAGYPTPVHLRALQNLGATPAHRRSFAPVRNIL